MMRVLSSVILLILPCYVYSAEDLSSITNSGGTIYFAHDFESGSFTADAGTYSIIAVGGLVSGTAGTGCSDPASYHNTVISTDAFAFGSKSLKTPYSGSCVNEAFNRDTTIIQGATPLYEGYFRYYHKFPSQWNSASGTGAQHKFTKFNSGDGTLPIVHFSFSAGSKIWRNWLPNLEGHFDKDGVTRATGSIWVTASSAYAGVPYTGQNVSYDDYTNGLGDVDGEYTFDAQWHCIEYHWKVNSDLDTADAVFEMWIDGVKIFGVYNFKYYNTGPRPYVNNIELEHIYYNRSAVDQPTYMDNIVIADKHIGMLSSKNKSLRLPTGDCLRRTDGSCWSW